jgi:NTE family protein
MNINKPIDLEIHLALSGGGFRAAFFHLGVLRRLYQLGLFNRIKTISSVSGGSFLNGLIGLHYDSINSLEKFDELLTEKLRTFSSRNIRKQIIKNFIIRQTIRFWPFISRWANENDTQKYANEFNNSLYNQKTLANLSSNCRFIINATNLQTGCRFRFEKNDFGDYRTGYSYDTSFFLLGDAVAASGAFPGFFSPLRLTTENYVFYHRDETKADKNKNVCVPAFIQLSDGGVYDNLGVEPLERECVGSPNSFVVVSDAAQAFDDRFKDFSWLSSIYRSYLVTYNRNLNRVRQFVGQNLINKKWRGVYFNLGKSCRHYRNCPQNDSEIQLQIPDHLGWGDAEVNLIGKMRTDLNTFQDIEIDYLLYHGATLLDVSLQKWHSELYQNFKSSKIEKPVYQPEQVKTILENSTGLL